MEFLYFLESIRNPVLDFIMGAITYLGDEVAFLAICLAFIWCVDKHRGYFLLSVSFVGVILNQILKLVFRIDRPWVKDPNFKPVESAVPAATGYSFPSGHTQNATGVFTGITITTKRIWLRVLSVAAIVLVAFSRMYLGVHTPLDVGVSLVLGIALSFAIYPLFKYTKDKPMGTFVIFCVFLGISVIFFIATLCLPTPASLTADELANIHSAQHTGATLLGAVGGVMVAYILDLKFIKSEIKAPILIQILKLVVGMGIVVGLKSVLKIAFGGDDEILILRALRYFIVVVFAGAGFPATFKWFNKLGKKLQKNKN